MCASWIQKGIILPFPHDYWYSGFYNVPAVFTCAELTQDFTGIGKTPHWHNIFSSQHTTCRWMTIIILQGSESLRSESVIIEGEICF